jgi:hypothetical protein
MAVAAPEKAAVVAVAVAPFMSQPIAITHHQTVNSWLLLLLLFHLTPSPFFPCSLPRNTPFIQQQSFLQHLRVFYSLPVL